MRRCVRTAGQTEALQPLSMRAARLIIAAMPPDALFQPLRNPEAGLFRLRQPRIDDLDAMLTVWGDPAVMAPMPSNPLNREDVWRRLLMYLGHWSACRFGPLAIARVTGAHDDSPGVYVGETGFYRFQRGVGPDFDEDDEMGWIMGGALHGSGLAAAACSAALQWAATARPGRIVCMISDANAPSRALSERLGFSPYRAALYKGVATTLFQRTVGG